MIVDKEERDRCMNNNNQTLNDIRKRQSIIQRQQGQHDMIQRQK